MIKYYLIGAVAVLALLAVAAYSTGYFLGYEGRPGLLNKPAEVVIEDEAKGEKKDELVKNKD